MPGIQSPAETWGRGVPTPASHVASVAVARRGWSPYLDLCDPSGSEILRRGGGGRKRLSRGVHVSGDDGVHHDGEGPGGRGTARRRGERPGRGHGSGGVSPVLRPRVPGP